MFEGPETEVFCRSAACPGTKMSSCCALRGEPTKTHSLARSPRCTNTQCRHTWREDRQLRQRYVSGPKRRAVRALAGADSASRSVASAAWPPHWSPSPHEQPIRAPPCARAAPSDFGRRCARREARDVVLHERAGVKADEAGACSGCVGAGPVEARQAGRFSNC